MTPPSTRTDAPLILVVDDVADSRYTYPLYLTTHGFRVIEAANGAGAVRLAQEQPPALMDMGLPVMDSWKATRRIKADRDALAFQASHQCRRGNSHWARGRASRL